jgi:hypothetical protein
LDIAYFQEAKSSFNFAAKIIDSKGVVSKIANSNLSIFSRAKASRSRMKAGVEVLDATDALLSLPFSGRSSSSSLPICSNSKISYASVKTDEYYQIKKGKNKGYVCQIGISDPKDLRWMPSVGVDIGQFDLSLVAPKQVFYGNTFGAITHESKKIRVGVTTKEETFAPFDEIVSVVTGFEYTVWPVFRQGCYNTYVERNATKGYMFCKTACGAMATVDGEIPNCRLWVGFKRTRDARTGADVYFIFQ